ncbi:uncharacterized protein K489DRAFT_412947 [Dissoconium aciculare CBS 342.82]|uniref:Uncharacterized protein n=1 Tax=Dissoconium aciculare CBS 342.82 TaxID=1314786 RepID=A0A6J3LV52_9PEZI|nr:uncharacterized protein K489DRAFT_412947 [Dissoconium aciculare CBS 342.82]KAF1819646.1 hypothetical protein K489DRAFT_412947 [Dissoconium aciculare CBS 342.82]
MAEQAALLSRQKKLSKLDLSYPLWLFDIDNPRWPRRLDSLLPETYPAQLTGWQTSSSEYGMHLDRPQDVTPSKENDVKSKAKKHDFHTLGKLAQEVLQQLRFDDRFDLTSWQAVVRQRQDDGSEESTVSLDAWVFDRGEPGWIDPSELLRIERKWDHVHLWNPTINLNKLPDYTESFPPLYGIATLISSDAELLLASGITKRDPGEVILPAEFERLDTDSPLRRLRGIVCTPTYKEPSEQGIMLNQGPESAHNQRLLAGTALQNAAWGEIVEFRKGERKSPLPLK